MAAISVSTDVSNSITGRLSPISPGATLKGLLDRVILTRPIDRIAFVPDASLYRLVPRAVVQPINPEEVRPAFS